MLVLAFMLILFGFLAFVLGLVEMEGAKVRQQSLKQKIQEYHQNTQLPVSFANWYQWELKTINRVYEEGQVVLILSTVAVLVGLVIGGLSL